MGSGGKDDKVEDAASGRKGGDDEGSGGTGDEKSKEKDASLFSEGDKVLAYHGPLIYEAKVQRAEFRKKEWKYFVHYLGWSKNWDEWVGMDRLMAITDANLEIQKKLFKNQNVDKQSKGRVPQGRQKAPTESKGEKEGGKLNPIQTPKGKKRKVESNVSEEKDTDEADHVMKLPLPAVLKKQLVDDWESIQSGKLIELPKSPNVDEILKRYQEHKTKRENVQEDSLGEMMSGLQSYFNKALPAMLLYKPERAQYAKFVVDGVNPSAVYGAEHLLRLFVKLPELLVYTNMEDETLWQLQQRLVDFLKFLQKSQTSIFLSSYEGEKIGTRPELEDKLGKREFSKVFESRKDRNLVKAVGDKKDKIAGSRPADEKKEKKDASKPSDDRRDRKDLPKSKVDDKRDRKDAAKAAEERRERKDVQRAAENKKDKKEVSKSSDDKRTKMVE